MKTKNSDKILQNENTDCLVRRSHFIYKPSDDPFCEQEVKKPHLWRTLIYFPLAVMWMETVLKLASGFSLTDGLLYTLLFSLPVAAVLTVLSTFFKSSTANRVISSVLTAVFAVWYSAQTVYYNVFGTFFVVSSITNGGTGQALNSADMIFTAVQSRLVYIILIFIPLIVNIIFGKRLFGFDKTRLYVKGILIGAAIVIQLSALFAVNLDSDSADTKSCYNLYYGEIQQNAVCERFGLFTMQRIDINRLIFGYKNELKPMENTASPDTAPSSTAAEEYRPQIIETDFKKLSAETDNADLKMLYEYFASAKPSMTNEYTGMFEGYNVIFITAESFSQYAVDKTLTPTLYKMYSEGFQFDNFYSPAWGVSTTDGEYANLTGLIPKSGVWSFSQSAENNVSFPFTLSEQAIKSGVEAVKAYHNHTYDYYDRDKYLTNLGYDYSAIGKGLDLGENVWPNSDLKMMQKTVGDYVNSDSFSVYYMTVSGHGGYSYNTISERNFKYVENLDYSDEVKGYLAANIELDKAVEYLISELEKAGKLDSTLICITDDHYPYSLDEFNGLDELARHKVDATFERYKNAWLLWSGSMKKPVKVDTYCSSIDILPTMLNLLGYEYDSRTLSGTDVFGGNEPFTVFADRSWISQNGMYNSSTGEYKAFKNASGNDDIDELNKKCTNMFTVSRMILDSNAYAEMYGQEDK